MARQILRSVVFTTHQGNVLENDKAVVVDFLGSAVREKEFSLIGHDTDSRYVDGAILNYVRSVTPEGQLIQFYRGTSGYGGGCEECVLAQVTVDK